MSEQHRGNIKTWNDEKGYGFIQPEDRSEDVFLHISALNKSRRPQVGDKIYYQIQRDNKNRLRANNAKLAKNSRLAINIITLILFFSFILTLVLAFQGIIHLPVASFWYMIMSIITFIAYGNDKNRAIERKWRTPEARLHMFELLGGFPGAFLAQQFYRHKNKKRSYQTVFWMIVILHVWVWFTIIF
ncbi:MAG: DUF1294 domain-containing protein [Heteroscytonema crispum UTEX LB 1556]